MKILEVKTLSFPEIKVIRFARFKDQRGYFTEIYRKKDFDTHPSLTFISNLTFVQANVSFSKAKTIRGLHFQWDPYMSKLVRVIEGEMVDLILDIRKGSPTFGKIIAYDLSTNLNADHNEWIWVPKGFAHGSLYLKDTVIEYFCDTEWSPNSEASISPLASDIDWSLCDDKYKDLFKQIVSQGPLISDKDRDGYSLKDWQNKPESDKFIYSS